MRCFLSCGYNHDPDLRDWRFFWALVMAMIKAYAVLTHLVKSRFVRRRGM